MCLSIALRHMFCVSLNFSFNLMLSVVVPVLNLCPELYILVSSIKLRTNLRDQTAALGDGRLAQVIIIQFGIRACTYIICAGVFPLEQDGTFP